VRRTGTHDRCVREWLLNQATGGYVEYEAATASYRLHTVAEAFHSGQGAPWE
jgi:hypothetical protein